jgi:peptidoglycan-associated lipoprotein
MKKLILFSAIFTLMANVMMAQPLNKQTFAMMITTGDEQVELLNFYGALEWYEKAYESDKDLRDNDLAYKIANLHYLLRDYKKAVRWYKRVVNKRYRKGTNPYLPEARFIYGRTLKMAEDYDEAILQLEMYLKESKNVVNQPLAKTELTGAQMALGMTPVTGVFIDNAGKANTKTTETSPFLTDDGTLYYSSFLSDEFTVIDGKEGDYHLKIATSTRKELRRRRGRGKKKKEAKPKLGDFQEGKAITTKINREGYHTGNVTISPDGNTMFFTRMQMELDGRGNTVGESKLFYSEKNGKSWKGAKEVEGVNGEWLVKHPSVGEHFGNEVLFFSANMAGGEGGYDIYYATKKSNGIYGDPINLGEVLNTPGDDITPHYRDGNIYFSSTGHPGVGGLDIFSSQWNGSYWSRPINLGKGYNSPVDDFHFLLDKSGYNGALVSNRVGTKSVKSKTCCDDIFIVRIPEVVLELLATTFDEKDQALPGVSVSLIEVEGKDTEAQTNAKGNNFGFTLNEELSYMIIGKTEGYYPDTAYLNTVGLTKSTVINRQLKLKALPPPDKEVEIEIITEKPIELKNILFDFDDAKILPEMESDLGLVLEIMNQYPDMVIELGSHTDAQGNDSYNQRLSQRRATSSKAWLTEKGIKDSRVKAVGYGETQIRNQCVNGVKCPDEEHRYNRRTEFKIISGPTSIKIKETRLQKTNGNGGIGSVKPTKQTQQGNAKLVFEKDSYDLGELVQGDQRTLTFKFTNEGTEDVKIDFASGSCGCTVPDWPRKTFKPGESGEIEVEYDSKDKEGLQENTVDVYLVNQDEKGYPMVYIAKFKAFVKKK